MNLCARSPCAPGAGKRRSPHFLDAAATRELFSAHAHTHTRRRHRRPETCRASSHAFSARRAAGNSIDGRISGNCGSPTREASRHYRPRGCFAHSGEDARGSWARTKRPRDHRARGKAARVVQAARGEGKKRSNSACGASASFWKSDDSCFVTPRLERVFGPASLGRSEVRWKPFFPGVATVEGFAFSICLSNSPASPHADSPGK